MKKIVFALFLCSFLGYSQGRSISFKKKIMEPYVTIKGDTLKVGTVILFTEGSNDDGKFKYVQLLSGMNEPLYQADSRIAFQKQEIKFFKEQNGSYYLFTKYFCANIEAALNKKEIEIVAK